ncbi:MAG: ArsR/SmtB family transcription factor [Candidatus Hodarchaeales archaeon]
MNEKEFFELIGNDTRREILRSIAREPKYLFQLAKELDKSQQSLKRHLKCLEEKGWIAHETVESGKGPARRYYRIARNISVRIMLSKHSFDFNVFEIAIGEDNEQKQIPLNHIEALNEDFWYNITEVLNEDNFKLTDQKLEAIRKLDAVLDQLGSIENLLLSRKLSITGKINEDISVKLDGDEHRKDRELAYTIFSSSAPITINLIQREFRTKRSDILESLRRLHEKELLPEHGLKLMKKLEAAVNMDPK